MMEGITIIVLEEILMANGLTVLMMWFLLFCRRKNRESLHVGDKIYDGIAIVNLVGALSETIAFLVDGKQFTGSRQIISLTAYALLGQSVWVCFGVCTWNCVSIEIIKEWFKKQEWRYFPGW